MPPPLAAAVHGPQGKKTRGPRHTHRGPQTHAPTKSTFLTHKEKKQDARVRIARIKAAKDRTDAEKSAAKVVVLEAKLAESEGKTVPHTHPKSSNKTISYVLEMASQHMMTTNISSINADRKRSKTPKHKCGPTPSGSSVSLMNTALSNGLMKDYRAKINASSASCQRLGGPRCAVRGRAIQHGGRQALRGGHVERWGEPTV
jgi:hypothetical protein